MEAFENNTSYAMGGRVENTEGYSEDTVTSVPVVVRASGFAAWSVDCVTVTSEVGEQDV